VKLKSSLQPRNSLLPQMPTASLSTSPAPSIRACFEETIVFWDAAPFTKTYLQKAALESCAGKEPAVRAGVYHASSAYPPPRRHGIADVFMPSASG